MNVRVKYDAMSLMFPALFSSCVSTTSLTLWRVTTRSLATVELLNAGSGLTEENKNTTNLNAFLWCYGVWML